MTSVQMTNSLLSLSIAIVFGVLGTISLKLAHGFTNPKHLPPVILYYIISFIAMTYAINHLELSTVYAIWSGIGTFLVSLVGIFYFKEPISVKKTIYLFLIVIGVLGIHLNAFS